MDPVQIIQQKETQFKVTSKNKSNNKNHVIININNNHTIKQNFWSNRKTTLIFTKLTNHHINNRSLNSMVESIQFNTSVATTIITRTSKKSK
jgi:hypothetical protein